jgi:hypothetical protein
MPDLCNRPASGPVDTIVVEIAYQGVDYRTWLTRMFIGPTGYVVRDIGPTTPIANAPLNDDGQE